MNLDKYRTIPFERRSHCMICGSSSISTLIALPDFPISEIYVPEKIDEKLGIVDQDFQFCSSCNHGQIANVIDVELQYGDAGTYSFRTSQSISGRETSVFFAEFVNSFLHNRPLGTVVEVGCNDLYLLSLLANNAKQLIGIDPILKGYEAELSRNNIFAIGDFFEAVDIPGDTNVVLLKDVLEHVSDPKGFIKKIVNKISPETVVFVQVPLLETILEDCRFDQVFHQHLNYFTIQSFQFLLHQLGCFLLDYTINYEHWGTGLFAFKKGSGTSVFTNIHRDINEDSILTCYNMFKADMELTNRRIQHFKNEKMYGYGAALMLPVISYYLGNNFSQFISILDDDYSKCGRFYLNLPVPIQHPSNIEDIKDSVVCLTAISSKINIKRIFENLFVLGPKHIIYPLRTI